MKHKKDLPRKYRKYVLWEIVQPDGVPKAMSYRKRAIALDWVRNFTDYEQGKFTVRPVLCLPLSMIRPSAREADKTTLFIVNGGQIIDKEAFDKIDCEKGPVDA